MSLALSEVIFRGVQSQLHAHIGCKEFRAVDHSMYLQSIMGVEVWTSQPLLETKHAI